MQSVLMERRVNDVRTRQCIPWLLAAVTVAGWSAAARGQPPGRSRGGFSFDSVLQRHDKNDDGKVTREEWQGPEEFFGRMDTDKDGVITKEEFQARMRSRFSFGSGIGGGFGGPRRPGVAPQGLDAAGLLKLLDANKDGSVSKDELKKFFERADADKSESLSKDELAKALAPPARGAPKQIDGPSVVEGRKAGIEVGGYAPDFELQPIEPYPQLQKWLRRDAPVSIEEKVKLSQLIGKQPVLLLYGSYT